MHHISITPAKINDVLAIRFLLAALYRELGQSRPAIDAADITACILDQSCTLLLACYDGQPVGLLRFSGKGGYRSELDCAIDELYVLPQFRLLRVGEQLLKQGVELARQQGWNSLSTGLNDRCMAAICRTAAFAPHHPPAPGRQARLFH